VDLRAQNPQREDAGRPSSNPAERGGSIPVPDPSKNRPERQDLMRRVSGSHQATEVMILRV